MKVIGFDFKKISAERMGNSLDNLKLETNINISDIKSIKPKNLGANVEILEIVFNYMLDYTPNLAKIEFKGRILLEIDENEGKIILNNWENKEMSDDFKIPLFNIILKKSTLKALELEEQLKLPCHIKLPSVKVKKE